MKRTHEYEERIKEYQKKYGIQVEERPQNQIPNPNSKYYKKKLNKKKKKLRLKQEQEQEQTQGVVAKEDPAATKETAKVEEKPVEKEDDEPWSQVKELEQ